MLMYGLTRILSFFFQPCQNHKINNLSFDFSSKCKIEGSLEVDSWRAKKPPMEFGEPGHLFEKWPVWSVL